MAKIKSISDNPFLFRYPPNNFIKSFQSVYCSKVPSNYETFGESITDKEAYRLQLTSNRAQVSSMTGSTAHGQYMFDDGKYDFSKDFSFALRPDISIVQLDEHIEKLKKQYDLASWTIEMSGRRAKEKSLEKSYFPSSNIY